MCLFFSKCDDIVSSNEYQSFLTIVLAENEDEEEEIRGKMPKFDKLIIPGKFNRFLFK